MRPLPAALLLAAALVLAFGRLPARAGPAEGPPGPGAKAPGFRLNDQHGRAVRLADVDEDHWVVLAFYPKADTPG